MPIWDTVEAFVRAVGGWPEDWLECWEQPRDLVYAPLAPPSRTLDESPV